MAVSPRTLLQTCCQSWLNIRFCHQVAAGNVLFTSSSSKALLSDSELAQSCPTLWDPMDSSQPSSSVHGIFQGRILEWVAISFSRRSSQPRDRTRVSRIVGRCFTFLATREGQAQSYASLKQLKTICKHLDLRLKHYCFLCDYVLKTVN